MSNVRQLLDNGVPIYPITDKSLVLGLQDAPFEYYVVAWDGASTPVPANIPAGVVVTYNGTDYTGTLAAGSATAPYLYLVASASQPGEYDRYITTHPGSSYVWTPLGSTAPVSPVIADDLVTNDSSKALSAKQGKILNDKTSELEAKVDDLGLEVNGKAAVNITGTIPMVANTGNVRQTGAYCSVNIPAGSYHFTIDTNYIGTGGVVYAVMNGTSESLGSVNSINNTTITLPSDATEVNVWANAANSPATGNCSFSFSQDGVRGIVDDIDDVKKSAEKVDGVDNSATATIPVIVAAESETQTKTKINLPKGDYYIDIVNPSIFSTEASYAILYVWKKGGTQEQLGYITPSYSEYWGVNNIVYVREASFDSDIEYIGIYHASGTFQSAGNLQLRFTQKNPLLSFDQKIKKDKDKGVSAQTSFSGSGTIAEGEVLSLPDVCTAKNFCLACEIDGTISEVNVGVGYDESKGTERAYTARWMKITPTTIEVWYNTNEDHLADTYTHGLTLDDKTCVSIVRDSTGNATLRIYTKLGAMYEVGLDWINGQGAAFVENLGSTSLDARITFTPRDLTKQIWVIGDSACGFGLNRWPGQMLSYGFDNFLVCARSGDAQKDGYRMLQNLLTLGRVPVYIVWAMGGNGPGDTPEGDPADYQKIWLYKFLRLCNYYQITPILTTVASFQSENAKHHGWSNYIRGLGYRYIDMADAIGSQQDGSSYPGMFGPDNIHHSVEGARMVAQRVLLDFPEIAVSEN